MEAARHFRRPHLRIIFKHILPNAVGALIVNATLTMAVAIFTETGLSYLGVGVKPPDTSLGLLISLPARLRHTSVAVLVPGLFIVLICLSINFIGDGLRDAFDPRQKKFNAKKAKPITGMRRCRRVLAPDRRLGAPGSPRRRAG